MSSLPFSQNVSEYQFPAIAALQKSAADGTPASALLSRISEIPDVCPYPYPSGSSMAEGVTVDAEGSVYGADFLGDVRKFVKKQAAKRASRLMSTLRKLVP